MSTPDPTHEAKVPSLRVAIERLFAIETLMRRGSPIATERTTALEEIRAALAADAEERKEIVAVLKLVQPLLASLGLCDDANCSEPNCDRIRPRLAALLAKLEGTVTT